MDLIVIYEIPAQYMDRFQSFILVSRKISIWFFSTIKHKTIFRQKFSDSTFKSTVENLHWRCLYWFRFPISSAFFSSFLSLVGCYGRTLCRFVSRHTLEVKCDFRVLIRRFILSFLCVI